jgi:hypothetical protein
MLCLNFGKSLLGIITYLQQAPKYTYFIAFIQQQQQCSHTEREGGEKAYCTAQYENKKALVRAVLNEIILEVLKIS